MTAGKMALYIQEMSVIRDSRVLLHPLSLGLETGQSLGVLGLNGAGKTTFLKAIMGLIPEVGGVCQLFGKSPRDPGSRSEVVFLPERLQLPSLLTGREYLDLQLRIHGKDSSASQVWLGELCLQLEMADDILKRRMGKYSRGMQQKLVLIALFLIQPRLMILDEMMSGLDVMARAHLRRLISEYLKKGGTLVFTTHYPEDLKEFSSHILVLREGQACFSDSYNKWMEFTDNVPLEEILLNPGQPKNLV